MKTIVYHNPECSKSRATLALLKEKGVEPEIIEYLVDPPTAADIAAILAKLGAPPRVLLREKEGREAGIDQLDGAPLIAAIAAHPAALQRPIIIRGLRAVIGRPPENVLPLLED